MEKNLGQVRKLLTSPNTEDIKLGLEICKKAYPFVYAALIDIKIPTTGIDNKALVSFDEAISTIDKNLADTGMGIGSIVTYRGLPNSPEMVISKIEIDRFNSSISKSLYVTIECKYFNKSRQEFNSVRDRIECFQLVNNK